MREINEELLMDGTGWESLNERRKFVRELSALSRQDREVVLNEYGISSSQWDEWVCYTVSSTPPPAPYITPRQTNGTGEGVEKTEEADLYRRFSMHDFLVDFLGGLVPGIVFTVATMVTLLPVLHLLIVTANGTTPSTTIWNGIANALSQTVGTPNTIWVAASIFALLFSYVVGHLFYRRDPKEPDRASFTRVANAYPSGYKKKFKKAIEQEKIEWQGEFDETWDNSHSERSVEFLRDKLSEYKDPCSKEFKQFSILVREKEGAEVDWKKKNLAAIDEQSCQFPYPNLADYLLERGHDHLVDLITWIDPLRRRSLRTSCRSNKPTNRSKTYVNRLKIRLNYHFPGKYRRIVRNEAHVRLATSTWYVAMALIDLAILSYLVVTACLFILLKLWHGPTGILQCIVAVVLSLLPSALMIGSHVLKIEWKKSLRRYSIVAFFAVFLLSSIYIFALQPWMLPASLPAAIMVLTAIVCLISTEKFVHYQRLREVFYVLELAYTAFRNNKERLSTDSIV